MRIRSLAFLVVLNTLGGFAPPRASSQPYRLVCSYFDEARATVYLLSDDGTTISRSLDLASGTDPQYVSVSPDGRFLSLTGCTPSATQSPYYFINRDGSFTDSHVIDIHFCERVVFDVSSSLLFVDEALYESKRINYSAQTVEATGYSQSRSEYDSEIGFSPYYGGLILPDSLYRYFIGVKTSPAGEFGAVSDPFHFTGSSNSDMNISSDGRFIAIIGTGTPQLTVLRVTASGEFQQVTDRTFSYQTEIGSPYRVRYTPDGRFLLFLSNNLEFLISFSVDGDTGDITEVDHATRVNDALGGYPIDALAITPDSRYVVALSGNYTNNEQTFLVFRLEDDGHLTRITQERHDWPGYVSDMDFIPPYRMPITAASTGWVFYQ